MPTAQTSIRIATPARYMARLCNHFAHRVAVEREPQRARIDFPDAPCALSAGAETLDLRIEAGDAATLERLQEVVIRHLRQVAPEETFAVEWQVAPDA